MELFPRQLRRYRGFLLDVDGVLVHDREPIPGALEAAGALRSWGKTLFVSNNSTLSRADYARKLTRLGLTAKPEDVLNSAALAPRYLDLHPPKGRVMVVGEGGLVAELEAAGYAVCDRGAAEWLVTGMDRQLSYDKLQRGLEVLLGGGRWITTNVDGTFPTPQGLRPGAGCVVGAFRGMGFEPESVVGKPSRFCLEQALAELAVDDPRAVLVIGDRLDSDIQGARAAGLDSLLVFSGVTTPAQLERSAIRPTYVASILGAPLGPPGG